VVILTFQAAMVMEVSDETMLLSPSVVVEEIVSGVAGAEAQLTLQDQLLVRLVVYTLVQEVVVLQLLRLLQGQLVELVLLV
jgi:hypothetical protein